MGRTGACGACVNTLEVDGGSGGASRQAETAMRGGIEDNLLTLIEEAATNIDKTLDQQMQEEVA
jgi:hypothetical protein